MKYAAVNETYRDSIKMVSKTKQASILPGLLLYPFHLQMQAILIIHDLEYFLK